MSYCEINGDVVDFTGGTLQPGAILKVFKVLSQAGSVISSTPRQYTFMADGSWSPLLRLERDSYAYIYLNAPGFDTNKETGIPLAIPNTASATLASLSADVNLPTEVPVVVPPGTVAIATTTKANIDEGDATGSLTYVTDDVRGLWQKAAAGYYSVIGEKVNVKEFGAKGDAFHVDDGAITSGDTTLTSATANFTSAMVGKVAIVKGAGVAGVPLITTVASRTNSTTIELTASASTTVSDQRVIIGTNDTTAIATAIAAASGKELYFPETSGYMVRMTATAGGAIAIPSNTTVSGDGPGSIIYIYGSDGQDGGSSADDDNKAAFYISDSTKNVLIKGLRFIGENGPYTEPEQNQSNVIYNPAAGSGCMDVLITECYFEDLFGFSIHCASENTIRFHVTNCTFKNNANGINVNADYSIQSHNSLEHCEGIEASGAYSQITNNILYDCGLDSHSSVALSIGGRTSIGSYSRGTIVARNQIINSRSGGIALADGFVEGQCTDNYLIKSYGIGIQLVQSSGNAVDRNTIAKNTIISCGHTSSGNPFGISISNGNDNKVVDNTVRDQSLSSYATTYTLLDSGTRTHIDGNTLSGTNKDLAINGTATIVGQNNIYDKTKLENTGTIASPVFRATKALTDNTTTSLIDINLATLEACSGTIHYRIWNGAGGEVQIRSGIARFSAVNKAGSYTSEITVVDEAASNSTGTLTGTWSIVSGTNKITIKINADTSIFGSTTIDYTLQMESPSQTYTIL